MADLEDDARMAVRALMDSAFGGVSDDTFDNVLGGVHAVMARRGRQGTRASDGICHAEPRQRDYGSLKYRRCPPPSARPTR